MKGVLRVYHRIAPTGSRLSGCFLLPTGSCCQLTGSYALCARLSHWPNLPLTGSEWILGSFPRSSYCVHLIPSAPEVPASIFLPQICVLVTHHQRTFPLACSRKLCCTHRSRDTHQQVNRIWACLALDNLHLHFPAQFLKISMMSPSVLCKSSSARIPHGTHIGSSNALWFYFIFHLVQNLLALS